MADGLFFEQLLGAELDALTLGAGDDLQAEDRVAAQFEEVVGAADLLQFQYVSPHGGELFLDLADRRGITLFDHARLGQGALVELAVGGHGQPVQQHDLRGHQVFRQARRQLLAQTLDAQARTGCRDAVRHQLQTCFVALQRLGQHHGFGDVFQGLQQLPDFARLDPVTADFHLIVRTAQVLQHAVRPARTVAGSIQTQTIGVRVRHEAFGGHRRTAQIALRQPATAQIQLARHTFGDRVQVGVQHPRLTVGQRLTDRHAAAGIETLGHLMGEDANRGFGRAIVIDDAAVRFQRTDLLDQPPGTGLAPQHQQLARQHVGRVCGLQQALQMAGHNLQHLNLMLGHVTGKTVRVERLLVGQQMQRAPRRQRTEQQRMAQVCGDRRDHRHACPVVQRQARKHALHVIGQRAVAYHHALRLPGGAGGVDDVSRLLGDDTHIQRTAIHLGPQHSIEGQHRAHAQLRGLVVTGRMNQQRRAAVTG
ncbi:hypothetical protein BV330_05236 [Pseudomonas syringae pv. actinidiae]|nr:hypothetical protein BV339_05214 [Pseudomonas syringae pv. actinidiae]OSN15095.1 hypothetical protein BV341_05369 [Pseudomonas syringae pv. actinidiae]OSN29520.1 hypothetical protein BV343_05183 [Pseudomonas syringae pv. actinidiae]OSN29633.1 hypothetical protein BV342_05408 [Pseudomonas syringae pv. actinidiae]OSN44868.1 hypothetical protein BV345_05124 [Pseudomonas syringae pv. actinidiae]